MATRTTPPPNNSAPTKFIRVSVTLPPSLIQQVDNAVRMRDTDRSKYVRDALRRKLGIITPA